VEQQQQSVGIDLHRRRSVIVRMNDAGEVLGLSKIDNAHALGEAPRDAGEHPEVALKACYGWYWAADLLQAEGPGSIWSIRWVCTGTPVGLRTT
jgi:hypothetical protein